MEDSSKLKENFLRVDFPDSLKWLFVGAVTWQRYSPDKDEHHLRALAMFASLIQARALYEFFYKCDAPQFQSGKNARAKHFVSSWQMPDDPYSLYAKYMASETPAQRRVFHLVYGRETPAGGSMGGGLEELKWRILDFAQDLKRTTQEFANELGRTPELDTYRELVECALAESLLEGCELAKTYGIPNPL